MKLFLWVFLAFFSNSIFAGPFLFGTSTASFQQEGNPEASDWRDWSLTVGKIKDGTNASVATDFWNRYDRDFALAQSAGMNAFRMSIAWERVEPRPGEFDEKAIAHYRQMILSLRAHGLEPVVTLQHFVLPKWLAEKGGLLAEGYPAQFARYARKMVQALSGAGNGAPVRYWMTLNEPNVLVKYGFRDGIWPPGIKNELKATQALGALAEAHLEAVREIRALNFPEVRVGMAHNWRVFQPNVWFNPVDWFITSKIDDLWNHQFMKSIMTGKINFSLPLGPAVKKNVGLPGGRPSLDFLGINTYGRSIVEPTIFRKDKFEIHEGPGEKSDLGWELYPESLVKCVKAASGYGLPMIISEAGTADVSDLQRQALLRGHFSGMEQLVKEGYRVFGYLHWSLTDNFEWAEGLAARFGLVEVDYRTGELKPRPSLRVYAELIRSFNSKHLSCPERVALETAVSSNQ